jgi:flavin reductase (DIM6/NTAB) family NADH-FMN oxidoreductase RutF
MSRTVTGMVASANGPLGPFPGWVADDDAGRDAYDRLRRRVLWAVPSGLYVVGSTDGGGRRNGMALNWLTQVSFEPKLVAIGVEADAVTHTLIEASGVFTVCLIAREDRAIIRKFTKPVEVDLVARTLNGFGFHERTTGAPVLDCSVAFIDCRVHDAPRYGNHTLFVGEVVDAGFLGAEDVEVLRMEDTRMNYGG